ncbi:unnamed protein product [Alopecurus aequalis]
MAMATWLVLRTFRRHSPPLRPSAPPSRAGLLHLSPRALLPNVRFFGGRSSSWSSKAVLPRCRVFFRNTLSVSLVSTSATATLDNWKGQLWRLATSSLLHCGIIHITLNMFALDDIGSLMEEVTSPGRFLAIYCTSALAGSLMSYRFVPGNSVGASDAIYGLFGAQAAYTWRRRESLTSARDTFKEIRDMIIFSLAFSLALRLIKVRIDNWAHLGGFLSGAAVELVLGPHEKQHVARIGTMILEDKESELCA